MSDVTRRTLAYVAVGFAVIVVIALAIVASLYRGALRSNVGDLEFRNRLRIPALLEPSFDSQGRKVFELDIARGRARLLGGTRTATWGVNGEYLGPTLRASRGDRVLVRVTNGVAEPTTIHWHGMHLPAAADGGPHQPIPPGTTWSPSWQIDQPAATLWYHAHPEGRTGDHVYRGVAGMFLLDDAGVPASLPDDYGVDDIPLVVQDKKFTDDGQLDFNGTQFSAIGRLGDKILVNGTYDPYLPVTTSLVRLRVLNASNARVFNLGFSDGRPFSIIATDAGLLDAPVRLHRLPVAPSERVELLVRFDGDDSAILRSYPNHLDAGSLPRRFSGSDDSFDLVRLVSGRVKESAPVPDRLAAPPPIRASADAVTRTFRFNHASRINGRGYLSSRVDFTAAPDTVEVWTLRNGSDNPHVFHVHGVSFTVLDYDGRSPPAWLRGRKDSLLLPRGTTARIAVGIRAFTDRASPYMFHCHLLAHEDHGMMGQFVVS
jgi:FtsP/CotA-like multicopper oxidase with cupredoxin domain